MKIVEPNVELWDSTNISPESHIAHCARVCYGKEYKEPNQEADEKMVDGLIKRGHLSMLRHASVYINTNGVPNYLVEHIEHSDYWVKNLIAGYASTNLQEFKYFETLVKNEKDGDNLLAYDDNTFLEECYKDSELFKLYRLTFCITTQDAIAKELNRKSSNNIAEKSTRYCNFKDGIPVCRPHWMFGLQNWGNEDKRWELYNQLDDSVKQATKSYNAMLEGGLKPEDARVVLPKVTATKVIYTYSVKEWQDILDLRLYDKTGPAHPDCHIVMQMVKDQINKFAKAHNINYQV